MINTMPATVAAPKLSSSSIQQADGNLPSFDMQVDTLERLKQQLLDSSSDSDSEMRSSNEESSNSGNDINEIDQTLLDLRNRLEQKLDKRIEAERLAGVKI